jgi:putative toxin-antitoxin system antitoxin component (TIGR02293 family)
MQRTNEEPGHQKLLSEVSQLLGIPVDSAADERRFIEEGIPSEAYERAIAILRLRLDTLAPALTPTSDCKRCTHLDRAASERLMRIAWVYARAVLLFGEEDKAIEWLNTPIEGLVPNLRVTPLEISQTEAGALIIESKIRRTMNGLF